MMIGDSRRSHPTVQIPPWDEDPTATIAPISSSPYFAGAHSPPASEFASPSAFAAKYAAALHRYLFNSEADSESSESDSFDSFSSDEFRIYEFKIRRCMRLRSHDWTECPFAHPGEKARRRDPRRQNYSGHPCPDFRKGCCKKGDSCEFAHGVFECWLHPTRYRTQPCKDGTQCTRRVCFFAHSPEQLRVLPVSDLPPPSRLGAFDSPPSDSPPMSPLGGASSRCGNSLSELVGGMRGLQVGSGKFGLSPRTCSWGFQLTAGSAGSPGFVSPRTGSAIGPAVCSGLPSTPTRLFDSWNVSSEEEPAMERVESGKNIRAAMYAKLRKDNSLDRAEPAVPGPDFGWVSELVK